MQIDEWWLKFCAGIGAIESAQRVSEFGVEPDRVLAVLPSWVLVKTQVGNRDAWLPAKADWGHTGPILDVNQVNNELAGRIISVRESHHVWFGSRLASDVASFSDLVSMYRSCTIDRREIPVMVMSAHSLGELASFATWNVIMPMVEAEAKRSWPSVGAELQYSLGLSSPVFDDFDREEIVGDYLLGDRVQNMIERATLLDTYAKVDPHTAMRTAVRRDLSYLVHSLVGDPFNGSMIRETANQIGAEDPHVVAEAVNRAKSRTVSTSTVEAALQLGKNIATAKNHQLFG
jgi:hypothetical protein